MTSKHSIIRALENVLEQVPHPREGGAGRVKRIVLQNRSRLRLYEFLCSNPYAPFSRIRSGLAWKSNRLAWHLKVLIKAGRVSGRKLGRRDSRYCVRELPENLAHLVRLFEKPVTELVSAIARSEGLTQGELYDSLKQSEEKRAGGIIFISRWKMRELLGELVKLGMVTAVADGRFRRYYPGGMLVALYRDYQQYHRASVKKIVSDLQSEGMRPKILWKNGFDYGIELWSGREKLFFIVKSIMKFA